MDERGILIDGEVTRTHVLERTMASGEGKGVTHWIGWERR